MPCQTPYRGDTSQMLLFKIASCLAEGGAVAGVASFNGRTGVVTLTSGDVIAALGCTPACEADTISQADGDARYVLKAGDTMTGLLTIGTAAEALRLITSDAGTTNTPLTLELYHRTSGTPAANFGTRLQFYANSSTTADQFQTRIDSQWVDATHATRSSQLVFGTRTSGGVISSPLIIRGAQLTVLSGALGAPSYSFQNELSTGIWQNGVGNLSISVTGALVAAFNTTQVLHTDGTAALPALTFQGDPDTGIYRIGANSFGSSAGGSVILATSTTGINLTTALAYQYNSVNVIRAQTALDNYFFGPSGNLTMTGNRNLAFGFEVLVANTSGIRNTGIGFQVLKNNTTGNFNTAIGDQSMVANTTGQRNSAFGLQSLTANTTGSFNTAIGEAAMIAASTSSFNTAIGDLALGDLTTAATGQNTAIGYNTGRGITTGNNNTILGANVTGLAAALSNNIILADGAGVIRLQIDSSGNTTLAGTVATAAGTAALPAHTFSADLDTGIYRVGANHLGVSANGVVVLGVGAAALGFFAAVAAAPVAQQVSGANLTNNVTAGGVNDTIADYADLVIYANDAAAIRNDIYQLARKLKQVNDALRAYGLLT